MALIEGPQCPWNHEDCHGHSVTPLLDGLPKPDPAKVGRCWCGQVGSLWNVPLDNRYYCRACLRMALRIAIYPERFNAR